MACYPLTGNEVQSHKIALMLATQELARRRGGVTIEGKETLHKDVFKISIDEDILQVVRGVREVRNEQGMQNGINTICVEIEELS